MPDHKKMLFRSFLSALFCLTACGDKSPSSQTESTKTAAVVPVDASEDADVGYDLRRVRPRDEPLETTFDRLRSDALKEGKRVAVLFSADWCQPCVELELELGNRHPKAAIEDVRILVLKEKDWVKATRMDEFNQLRARWSKTQGTYPFMALLTPAGKAQEDMFAAVERLKAEGLEPTLPVWFQSTRGE